MLDRQAGGARLLKAWWRRRNLDGTLTALSEPSSITIDAALERGKSKCSVSEGTVDLDRMRLVCKDLANLPAEFGLSRSSPDTPLWWVDQDAPVQEFEVIPGSAEYANIVKVLSDARNSAQAVVIKKVIRCKMFLHSSAILLSVRSWSFVLVQVRLSLAYPYDGFFWRDNFCSAACFDEKYIAHGTFEDDSLSFARGATGFDFVGCPSAQFVTKTNLLLGDSNIMGVCCSAGITALRSECDVQVIVCRVRSGKDEVIGDYKSMPGSTFVSAMVEKYRSAHALAEFVVTIKVPIACSSKCLTLDDFKKASAAGIESLVDMMASNVEAEDDAVAFTCQRLTEVMQKNKVQQATIAVHGGFKAAVQMMWKSNVDDKVLMAACQVLSLVGSEHRNQVAIEDGGVRALVRMLMHQGASSMVLISTCEALQNLLSDLDARTLAIEIGVVQGLSRVLINTTASHEVLLSVCTLLILVHPDSDLGSLKAICEGLVSILGRPNTPDILLTKACELIIVIQYSSSCDSKISQQCLVAVSNLAAAPNTSPAVHLVAVKAISCAISNRGCSEGQVDADVVQHLFDAVENTEVAVENTEVADADISLQALLEMMSAGDPYVEAACKCGGVQILISNLGPGESMYHLALTSAVLYHLCRNSDAARKLALAGGGVEALVLLIRVHGSDTSVLHRAFLALVAIERDNVKDWKLQLEALGAVPHLIKATKGCTYRNEQEWPDAVERFNNAMKLPEEH